MRVCWDGFSLQEIIDLLVGDAVCVLIRPQRSVAFQIRRRDLDHQVFGRPEMTRKSTHAALVEPGQRQDVGGAVAMQTDGDMFTPRTNEVPVRRRI
ncbi:hypothetical protein C8P69_12221 [Phreatobacter oligotrophus]|uniref:Uncharacterized protein n=1 Tax=Phreatobacter oligotrophus TaxID=1122261 RepID=A0A2T4YWK5_9HYPH|nr:hypothetical protein C8P69_12221 [Phreatobacter oligotrophus]